MSKKLKPPEKTKGKLFAPHSADDVSPEQLKPLFSLEFLQPGYSLSDCDKDEKAAFADTLHRLSQLTWNEIKQAQGTDWEWKKLRGTPCAPESLATSRKK